MTRQIAIIGIVTVLAGLATIAALGWTASPHTIELLHVVSWVLGLIDVGLVAASFLLTGTGGH